MYSIGGAAGSRLMMVSCSRRPTLPSPTALWIAANEGSKRRLKPNITGVVMASSSDSTAVTSAMSRAIGFSQSTALPAFAAASRCGMCSGVGEPMITASMFGSVKMSSVCLAARAP